MSKPFDATMRELFDLEPSTSVFFPESVAR
jgi:hypothetical protein